jgi:chorismate dehydratase
VTTPVRLGAVDYLNVRPLVYGLEQRPREVTLRFDPPSRCAELLAGGDIDLGTIPSIAYLDRPGDRVVPGLCIGSEGPVASVAIFTRQPVARIRSIALDTSSRTSAALTRICCARIFDIRPEFVTHPPDLPAMLAAADAALIIGDPALFADADAYGAEKIDLGSAWTTLTGLPFVWAFWAGPPSPDSARLVPLLQQAAADGLARRDVIADAYCPGDPVRQAIARSYLHDRLRFELDDRALAGLERYYQEAAALGLVREARALELFR